MRIAVPRRAHLIRGVLALLIQLLLQPLAGGCTKGDKGTVGKLLIGARIARADRFDGDIQSPRATAGRGGETRLDASGVARSTRNRHRIGSDLSDEHRCPCATVRSELVNRSIGNPHSVACFWYSSGTDPPLLAV